MAGNGNGNGGLDLLLKLATDVENLDRRAATMEGTVKQARGSVQHMAQTVTELSNHFGALSEQVHEFRVGVGAMKESFDKVGVMLKEVLIATARVDAHEKSIQDLVKRVTALEPKP